MGLEPVLAETRQQLKNTKEGKVKKLFIMKKNRFQKHENH